MQTWRLPLQPAWRLALPAVALPRVVVERKSAYFSNGERFDVGMSDFRSIVPRPLAVLHM
jgi:hypothetical protein